MMISDKFLFALTCIGIGCSFLPTCIFIFKRVRNPETLTLFIYLALSTFIDTLSLCFKNNFETRNIIQYFFTIFEILLISKMYLNIFSNAKIKLLIKLLSLTFVVIYLLFLLFTQSFHLILTKIYFVENIIIVFYSISYLYKITKENTQLNVLEDYFFWINSAFLIQFGSNFIFYLSFLHIDFSVKYNIQLLGLFYLIIAIIYNSILTIGVWKIKRV